jgi:hypothetical protein
MAKKPGREDFIFKSPVNNFFYLYSDAEYFNKIAHTKEMQEQFDQYRLCRTAVLLCVLSLEALINRALDHFLPEHLHDYFMDPEDRLSVEDKWQLLPLLGGDAARRQFDRTRYPWSHFAELIRLRNDFVHPKHDRYAYYRVIHSHKWEPLKWNKIPKTLNLSEDQIVYRQSRIPKDPYALRPDHVVQVKKIVDDMVRELDGLLEGKIMATNWHTTDQMTLFHPPGATLADLPPGMKQRGN